MHVPNSGAYLLCKIVSILDACLFATRLRAPSLLAAQVAFSVLSSTLDLSFSPRVFLALLAKFGGTLIELMRWSVVHASEAMHACLHAHNAFAFACVHTREMQRTALRTHEQRVSPCVRACVLAPCRGRRRLLAAFLFLSKVSGPSTPEQGQARMFAHAMKHVRSLHNFEACMAANRRRRMHARENEHTFSVPCMFFLLPASLPPPPPLVGPPPPLNRKTCFAAKLNAEHANCAP